MRRTLDHRTTITRFTDATMTESPRIARVTTVSRWLCLAGASLGALGLVGWMSRREFLLTLVPGQPPMMPNTALALTLLGMTGAALGRGRPGAAARTASAFAALIVLAVGIGTLAEYALGVDLGIDQLLIPSELGPYPGRPSPLTAMALALIGLAILFVDSLPAAETRPSEWLLVAAALTAMVGLTGQILGTGAVYRLPRAPVVGMAVPTAVSLLLSSTGILLGRPTMGLIAVATSDGPGGVLLRRIAVPFVVVPMALGFVITRLFAVLNVDEFPLAVASIVVASTAVGLATLVVTARLLNHSHAALEMSRRESRELFSLASDGIFVADLDGRYSDVNEAGCRLLGLTRAEIVGKTIQDFLHPDETDRLATARSELGAGGAQIAEWRVRHKSGIYVPVEVSTRILPGGRWQAFVRDIRERKAAEEEALRSKARIEGIVSIAADAIISIDESQRITIFNRGAEQIFGWPAAEIMGQPLDILIPERFRNTHRSHVRAFAEEPVSARRAGERHRPIYGLRKDGTEFVAEAAISKLRIADELTFTVVMHDVTHEQRRAEEERLLAAIGLLLTSSLEREHVVREAAHLLVHEFAEACVIDLVDDPAAGGRVTRSAVVHRDPQKTETALALEHIDLERERPHLASASLRSRKATLVSPVTAAYLDSISQSAEHRRLLDELAPASLITVALQARGLLLGVLTLVSSDPRRRYDESDVAFANEIGQRLALSIDNARLFETATGAIAARDEVLRIVAHDLRNPLGVVLMRASLMKLDGSAADGERRAAADAIETAAKRMNRLIQDLLDVTRSEAGALSVQRAPVSVRAIVGDAVNAQRELAAGASIELRSDVLENPPDVRADRDRLLQIFENLIGNAIRFTPPGGRIVVGAVQRGRHVVFCVTDTGAGIAAEDLPHVFDRFWQARKSRAGGAGLGLAIVKALVESHGGRVGVESTLGRGSTFYFTIPLAHQPAARRVVAAS